MKNNKGFTLIELIATITILSIIMLVAIPNIMGISIKSKNRTYINDANKLVTLVKYKFESDPNINKPTGSTCVRINLANLDQTELKTGPENGNYDLTNSYVVIRYNSTSHKYEYKVQLKEVYGTNKEKGVPLTDYNNILGYNDKSSLIKTSGWQNDCS